MTQLTQTLIPASEARNRLTSPLAARALVASATAAVACAPIKGYLTEFNPQLAKLPAVVLIVVWFAVRFRYGTRSGLGFPHIVIAALATVVLISTCVHSADADAIDSAIRWIPFLVITAILIDVVGTEVDVRWILGAAILGAAIAAGGALFSVLVLDDPRATGPVSDPNDLAYVLVAALPLVVGLAPRQRRWQVVLIALTALISVAALATFSRGGAIAMAAAVAWLVLRRALTPKTLIAGAAAVGLIVVVLAATAGPLLTKAWEQKNFIAQSNVDTRIMRWDAAAKMLAENPALGVGPGGFRTNYAAVSRQAEIPEQTPMLYDPSDDTRPVTHNMYLEVGAELGFVGLFLFLGVIVMAFVYCELALRGNAPRNVVIAVQASLIAVVIASTFLSEQYYMSLWSMIAVGCALGLKTRRGGLR